MKDGAFEHLTIGANRLCQTDVLNAGYDARRWIKSDVPIPARDAA